MPFIGFSLHSLLLWQVLVEKMGLPGGYTPSMDSSDLLSMLIPFCLVNNSLDASPKNK